MRKIYALLAAVAAVLLPSALRAQCDPILANDSSQFIIDNNVLCTETVGNILYFGGNFSLIGQNTGHFIGVDTATGRTYRRVMWPKIDGTVYKAISDGAGGWIVGGQFAMAGDSVRNNIAQIDVNGHVTSFNPNANGPVLALLKVGTTLYTGGGFTNIGGSARNRVAAINLASGSATSWNPNANNVVKEIYVYGSKLYVAGKFTNIGGLARTYLAVVDPATGVANAWDAGIVFNPGYFVSTLTADAGNLYIGGRFDYIGSLYKGNIGAIDTATALATGWYTQAYDSVNKIIINGANAYVGGGFDHIGSQTRFGLAEVSLTTGLSTGFNPSSTNYVSISDMVLSGNKLFVGGTFDHIGSVSKNRIACIDVSTATVTPWTGDAEAPVYTLGISNGKLFAGGAFTMMGCKYRSRAAAIDISADTITAWDPSPNYTVQVMAAGPSAIYFAGPFSAAGGVYRNGLASVDPVTGNATLGFNGSITWGYSYTAPTTMTSMLYYNGSVYFSGIFDNVTGSNRNNIGAVNAITGSATSWNPNPSYSYGYALGATKLARYGSTIFAGGSFNTTIGGASRTNFVGLDALSGSVTPWAPSIDGTVSSFGVFGNTLLVGGGFNNIDGVFAPRLAKINLSTQTVSTWSPYPDGGVNIIKPFQNIAFIGGDFGNIDAMYRPYITTIDTAVNIPGTWVPGPSYGSSYATVSDIALLGNRLYVAGGYYGIDGHSEYRYLTAYIIRAVADTIAISGNSTVCAGTPVTYTSATNVTGGTYRWRVNGVAAGTGSSYSYTPANGDQVKCTSYIPAGSCYTTDSAQSNIITMTVNPMVTPSVTVTGPVSACAGAPITDTATASIPVGNYQWLVNGVNAGTAGTYSYTPANGDHISCTFTPPSGCYSPSVAVSNTVTVTVNPNLDPITSVTTPGTTVCAGVPVAYHAHGINGLVYQWKVNGANAGLSDSTYTYVPLNGDSVKCVVTAPVGGCYIVNPDSSLNIGMTVIADTTPVVTITGSSSVCQGTADTFHLSANITGGAYHWYVNSASTGTTATSYSYTPVNGDNIRCVLTAPGAGCYAPSGDTSNIINIAVNANVVPLTAATADATTVCAGTGVHLNCMTNITGAIYQWYVNGFAVGSTTSGYSYAPLNGDVAACIVTAPVGACYTQSSDTSNGTHFIVNPMTTPVLVINGSGTMAPGETVTITATVNNAGSTYLITWYKNGVVFNTSGVPYASYIKTASLVDTITAKIISMSPGCFDTTVSNTIYIYGAVGIADVSAQGGISAYPNPSTGQITIAGLTVGDNVSVFDIVGRLVYSGSATNTNEHILDISRRAPGIYMLHVTGNNGMPKANISLDKR